MIHLDILFVGTVFLSTAFAWPTWQAGSNGVQWAEYCDFSGNDLYSKPSTGAQCGDLCAADSNCNYFTWTNYNNGTCWLKGGSNLQPVQYTNGYSVCGYVQRWPAWNTGSNGVQWAEYCDFSGNDLYSKPSTGAQCGDLCAADAACNYFTWTQYNNGTCWMKSGSNLQPIQYTSGYSVCGYIKNKSGGGGGNQVPYGRLAVNGKYVVSAATGQPVQLRGMSLFWSQWMGQFYVADTVKALKCSWNANVVRAAMGVENGGYLDYPSVEMQKVYAVIDAAIANGMYVIVDWHDHNAMYHQSQAVDFFSQVSKKYGSYPNIIYETFNEPLQVSWSATLKPYHQAVIQAIRANDPNNIIVVGTPNWSQYVDEASNDPITGYSNIAYTLHYYAGTHKQDLRNRTIAAINKNLPIFVTEYGTVNADGNGAVDTTESGLWWDFCDQNKISYVNWAIDDKSEGSAALIPGTTAQQVGDDSRLTASGSLVKNKLKSQNNGVRC